MPGGPGSTSSARSRSASTWRRTEPIVRRDRRASRAARPLLLRAAVLPGRTTRVAAGSPSAATGACSRCARPSCTRATSTRASRSTGSGAPRLNGEYGVMGDLGMHALHLPLRAGWLPQRRARDPVRRRRRAPGRPRAARLPCDTWDNAVLALPGGGATATRSRCASRPSGSPPARRTRGSSRWTARTGSIAFTTKQPKTLRWMAYEPGGAAGVETSSTWARSRLADDHRCHLRVRLLRRDPADVGGVPRRARPRARRACASPSTAPPRRRRRRRTALHRRPRVASNVFGSAPQRLIRLGHALGSGPGACHGGTWLWRGEPRS